MLDTSPVAGVGAASDVAERVKAPVRAATSVSVAEAAAPAGAELSSGDSDRVVRETPDSHGLASPPPPAAPTAEPDPPVEEPSAPAVDPQPTPSEP